MFRNGVYVLFSIILVSNVALNTKTVKMFLIELLTIINIAVLKPQQNNIYNLIFVF